MNSVMKTIVASLLASFIGLSANNAEAGVCENLLRVKEKAVMHLESHREGEPILDVCRVLVQEAERQGVDPALVVAVGFWETGLHLEAKTGSYIGPLAVHRKWCKTKHNACIPCGVGFLKGWRAKSKSWKSALYGYTGGYKKGLSKKAAETKRSHVRRVMKLWSDLKKG